MAVLKNSLPSLKKLVFMGLSVNHKDVKNRLPLHYACKMGYYDIVSFLIEAGSDVQVKDVKNMTPLEVGFKNGHKDLASIIG